jgi:hypothetical protein
VREIYKRGTVLGALAGAMLLASAQGAMAATEPTTSPEGFGIQAVGTLVTVPAQPIATSTTRNPPNVATVAAGLLTANAVFANVSADGNTVNAGAAGLSALGVGIVEAGAVSSTCAATANGINESVDIAGLTVGGVPVVTTNVAPNTTINLPLIGTLVLNQQVAGPVTGSQTVNALVIDATLLNETIIVGSSTCGPFAAGAPIAGGKGLALGLGALGAGAVGVTAVKLNRRRRLTNA